MSTELCPECGAGPFKHEPARQGHIRFKHGVARDTSVTRDSRGESPSSTPREMRQTTTVPERESALARERKRLADILARPAAETGIFDTPDRLLGQLSKKLIAPLMERVREAKAIGDSVRSLKPPPLPRLPRPPKFPPW